MINSYDEVVEELNEYENEERVVVGVGTVLKEGENFIFAISKEDYWDKKDKPELSFQNIGGEVKKSEDIVEALHREAEEEIDTEIEILDPEKYLNN